MSDRDYYVETAKTSPFWDLGPHEPVAWRRHGLSDKAFAWFGHYSARSMAKWTKLKGHCYDVLLANGQLVTVRPKRG